MKKRSFMIVLYLEDDSHFCAFQYMIKNFKDYAYIVHDKDFNENGELKKEHIHFLVKFKNPRSIEGLANEIGIKSNYIEDTKKDYKQGLRYLIHLDDKDKYQYNINEVYGPLKKILLKEIEQAKTEPEYIIDIISIIDSLNYIYVRDFSQIMCSKGLWGYYRRNASIINQIINEHNNFYLKKKE